MKLLLANSACRAGEMVEGIITRHVLRFLKTPLPKMQHRRRNFDQIEPFVARSNSLPCYVLGEDMDDNRFRVSANVYRQPRPRGGRRKLSETRKSLTIQPENDWLRFCLTVALPI
jgi:hypothetical protein